MRLLKFKEFTEVFESFLYESSGWESILISSYETMFPDKKKGWTKYKGSGTVDGEKEQIFRAKFGSVDAKENIEKFLTLNGIMYKNLEEVSKEESVTGDYQAFRFNVDQETPIGTIKTLKPGVQYFVVNWDISIKGNVVIGNRKSFTPTDLGFSDKEFFLDPRLLQEDLIKKITAKNVDQNIIDLISSIGNAIVNFNIKKETLNDFLIEVNKKGLVSFAIQFENSYKEEIPPENLSIIKNNIGEILGGILMLTKIKGLTKGVNFPSASNEQVIDFSVDKLGFSSKAGKLGGGAKAAATGFCIRVKNAIETIGWQPEPGRELSFYKNFIIPIVNHKEVGMRCQSRILGSNVYMLTTGFPKSSSLWDLFVELSKMPIDGIEKETIVSAFDLIKKNESLHKIVSCINSITRGTVKDKTEKLFLTKNKEGDESDASKLYDQMTDDQKIGIILYYSSIEFSKYINKNWSVELNSLLNKTLRNQQVYMDLDIKKNLVTFNVKSMQTGKFVLGSINGTDWATKQLSLSMIK